VHRLNSQDLLAFGLNLPFFSHFCGFPSTFAGPALPFLMCGGRGAENFAIFLKKGAKLRSFHN
jgi:hypothetical protein